MKIQITDTLYYYDGPLLVRGYLSDDPKRHFLMVAVNNDFLGLAVELLFADMLDVIQNRVHLQTAYTDRRIGPYYYGEVAGEGYATTVAAHLADVPEDHLPGDVYLYL